MELLLVQIVLYVQLHIEPEVFRSQFLTLPFYICASQHLSPDFSPYQLIFASSLRAITSECIMKDKINVL